jgi:hypothetical protein
MIYNSKNKKRKMDMNKGILTVKVKEGKLIRDTEYMGTMDPYCTITFKE